MPSVALASASALWGGFRLGGAAVTHSDRRYATHPGLKTLQDALLKAQGVVRKAAAEAGLVAAEGLLARGDRKGALALYSVLSRPDMPRSVRLAAMHSTIAAETSLKRPRPAPPAK